MYELFSAIPLLWSLITYISCVIFAADLVQCPICLKSVPMGNMTTHTAISHKPQSSQQNTTASHSQSSATQHSPKPQQHSKGAQSRAKKRAKDKGDPPKPVEDLDSLLAEAVRADSVCSHARCKKGVNMLGLRCQFCARRFCMQHGIPEVHGCAEEAKRHARSAAKPNPRGDTS